MAQRYPKDYGEPITCTEHAAIALGPAFRRSVCKYQESFFVLLLDAKNRPIGRPEMIALGTINKVEVAPRDVFRAAIKKNARALIVAHNHPSNELEPSEDDKAVTQRLVEVGKIVGITVLDHIVITHSGYLSMAEIGLL
jgi:DNA repair protein RadC